MVIYAIEHIETGRRYIGSAVDRKRRWRHHVWMLNTNRHCNPHLQRAWNKYGAAAFQFIVLENVTDAAVLYEREQRWIDRTSLKYNLCPVAGSALGRPTSEATKEKLRQSRPGYTHSDETKAKIREALSDPRVNARMREMNKGRKHTPEAVANMSVGRKGRKVSAETRAKMSAAHVGRVKTVEHRQNLSKALSGKPKSPETIEKIRALSRARFASPEGRAKAREMAALGHAAKRLKKQSVEKVS